MTDSPIFDALRKRMAFQCQTCTDNGWPYNLFFCAGENGLCD